MSETKSLSTVPIGGEMSRAPLDAATMAAVLLDGNLARLKDAERVAYMTRVCDMLGLNPLTKPFEFITLNGKLVMYARRECTEQLRKLNGVSVRITSRELVEDIYVVTAQASDRTGRCDESTGAVSIKGLAGEAKANALMKAETKAKRRVTLSISGLGMLDESEVGELPKAPTLPVPPARHGEPTSASYTASVPAAAPSGGRSTSAAESEQPPSPASPADSSSDDEPKPGEYRDQVEVFVWKWYAGRPPTKPERAAAGGDNSKLGEWVSTGAAGMEPQRSDAQNARLHVLRQQRGYSDPDWRDKLYRLYGKASSADLSVREASDFIDRMQKAVDLHGTADQKRERQQRRLEDAGRELGEAIREPGSEG